MRENLFRSKGYEHKRWVCGDIIHLDDDLYINCNKFLVRVDPQSVGQYTGLKDRNGTRIFEGDILKFDWRNGEQYIGEVVWNSEYACFDINPHTETISAYFGIMGSLEFEVIGNIYDNPGLLKAEVNE